MALVVLVIAAISNKINIKELFFVLVSVVHKICFSRFLSPLTTPLTIKQIVKGVGSQTESFTVWFEKLSAQLY